MYLDEQFICPKWHIAERKRMSSYYSLYILHFTYKIQCFNLSFSIKCFETFTLIVTSYWNWLVQLITCEKGSIEKFIMNINMIPALQCITIKIFDNWVVKKFELKKTVLFLKIQIACSR